MGGWGGLTLGLLKPIACGEKSFGVFGMDATTITPCAYSSHQEKSFIWQPDEMGLTNQNSKYLVVSLWAAKHAGANGGGQDTLADDIGSGNNFEILFSSSTYKTANTDTWAAPAQPAAATDM